MTNRAKVYLLYLLMKPPISSKDNLALGWM